jgi:uncharacterized protein (DUF2062 family)/SAM-dependent methyltransferase
MKFLWDAPAERGPPRSGRPSPVPVRAGPPFSFWREELKRGWSELRGPGTTPARAAVSVAIGLFVGSLPIFGCHTPIVVVLCVWFQLDAAVAWVAANVSNPLFAPALLAAEIHIGAWLRHGAHGAPLVFDRGTTRAGQVRHVLGDLFLGAPVAALGLAVLGAAVAYGLAALAPGSGARPRYRLPDNAPVWVKTVERVASRFASPSSPIVRERTRFHYLRAKLLGDPAARVLADLAAATPGGFGALLDIGTGHGQIPLLLLELGGASSAHGVDWDGQKIASAEQAAAADGAPAVAAVFTRSDLRTASFEPADTVLLIDVLHYFALGEQDAILDRAAAAVRPGGRLLLRDADTQRGWRSWMTLAEERVFTLLRFNRGERVCFRPALATAARLEAAGLRCTVRPAWGRTPFSNVLVVGQKKA